MKFNSFLYKKNLSHITRPFAPFLGSILMFHRVVEPDENPRLPENQLYEVTPAILCETISFYRDLRYNFVSLDEMVEIISGNHRKERFVCFTFDDGYTDTFTTAYPILQEEKIPFCVYITTDFPERKAAFWWNMLEDVLLSRDRINFNLDGKKYAISCGTITEKGEAFSAICQLVLKSKCGISAAWKAIFEPLDISRSEYAERMAMSWEQINCLGQDPLVTIGAHTRSHPSLAGLDDEEARAEMDDSRRIIQERTGLKVDHFSYPYGSPMDVTDRDARLVSELGFKSAVTTETGNVYPYHRKKMTRLPRVHIPAIDTRQTLTLVSNGCITQTFIRS